MNSPRLEFKMDRILIENYPYKAKSCRTSLHISATEIDEVDAKRCVLLVKDELIYLPGWPKNELCEFCSRNGIVVRERYDVWGDILDPFVDTSFTHQEIVARSSRLEAANFSSWRVSRLRWLYALPIIVFQGIAGEWTGLHHYHLLHSLRYLRLLGLYGVAYRHTMGVALEAYR